MGGDAVEHLALQLVEERLHPDLVEHQAVLVHRVGSRHRQPRAAVALHLCGALRFGLWALGFGLRALGFGLGVSPLRRAWRSTPRSAEGRCRHPPPPHAAPPLGRPRHRPRHRPHRRPHRRPRRPRRGPLAALARSTRPASPHRCRRARGGAAAERSARWSASSPG